MALARELSFRLPLQRGDDVRAVQQALIRAGTLAGAMPSNVSVRLRAKVSVGLAKLVDDVNQQAAVI